MDKKEIARKLVEFLKKRYGEKLKFRMKEKNVFKLLVFTILSQRTRDENTERAGRNLFSRVDTPQDILNLKLEELERLIKSAGMYRQKAEKIREVCEVLVKKYGGKVPRSREELLALPGVGFKTADIVLSYGYGIPTIAIDTHCNRISKRIGLVEKDADVEEVKERLEDLIPKKDWLIVNLGLVNFGKDICKPVRPRCGICPLRKYCNYSARSKNSRYKVLHR